MKKSNKILTGSLAIVLLVVIFSGLLFFKCGGQILYKVPGEAVSVLVLNIPALSSKLFMEEIGSENKIGSRIAKHVPDSLSDIDWTSNGLGLFNKIVLFTLEDTSSKSVSANFIIPIKDAGKFNSLMQNIGNRLHFSISKKREINYAYCSGMKLLAAWDKHYVTGMKTSENSDHDLQILFRTLSTPQRQSIMSDTGFLKKLARNDDLFLYTRAYRHCPVEALEIFNSGLKCMAAYINFNNGELDIKAEVNTKPGSTLRKAFADRKHDMCYLANGDSAIVNILLNIDPAVIKELGNKCRLFDFKTAGTSYFDCWDGSLYLALRGSKKIENEYITYTFDDNFNKIEQKEIKSEPVINLQAAAGYQQTILDSLSKRKTPIKKGSDTLLYKGGNFVLTKTGHQLLTYNRYFTKLRLSQYHGKNNLELKADCQKLAILLQETGMAAQLPWLNKISCKILLVTISQDEFINVNCKLIFADQKKNAYYSLFEMVEKF